LQNTLLPYRKKRTILLAALLVATVLDATGRAHLALSYDSLKETVVKIEPSLVEFGDSIGDQIPIPGTQFNVTVNAYNVTDLYGFDLKFRWNTTFLQYVRHYVHVSKDTYSDGILWNPTIQLANEVNVTAGTYWVAYASMLPAPAFNGSGSFFTITFEIKKQPFDYETGGQEIDPVDTVLEFISTDLAKKEPVGPIPHSVQNAIVRIWERSSAFPYPTVEVIPTRVERLPANSYFNVNIWIFGMDPSSDISSFNITLTFNTTLVEGVYITEGAWPRSYALNVTEIVNRVDNAGGTATYAMELGNKQEEPPTAGILFTVEFKVVYESLTCPPPSCELALRPTSLVSRTSGPIFHQVKNGTYTANRPPPVAKFTWSPNSYIMPLGQIITFNASDSYHRLGAKITQYAWDFGDQTKESTTAPVITHTYANSGNFTVVLNVTDIGGFWNSTSAKLFIVEPPPLPRLVVEPKYLDLGPYPPQVVGHEFNISIYIESLDAAWSLQSLKFSLTYNVTLIDVKDDLADIIVPDTWPGPNEVTLVRQTLSLGKVIVKLQGKDFPQSGKLLATTVKFTVLYQGIYPTIDDSGLTLSDIQLNGTVGSIPTDPPINGQFAVRGLSPPLKASFACLPPNPRIGEAITFDASNSTPDGFIANYTWNFGDLNVTTVRVPIVTHQYHSIGTHYITLRITDIYGSDNTSGTTVFINKTVPTVTISAHPALVTLGSIVAVDGTISPAVERANVSIPIECRSEGEENWTTLITVKINDQGHYTYSWKPDKIGKYQLTARWPGDESTYPSSGEVQIVTVKAQPTELAPYIVAGIVMAILVSALFFIRSRRRK